MFDGITASADQTGVRVNKTNQTAEALDELRQRYYVGGAAVGALSIGGGVILVALLWNVAPRSGLLVWITLITSMVGLYLGVKRFAPRQFDVWFRWAWIVELLTGLSWGSLVLLAMPSSVMARMLLVSLYIASMLISTMSSSQFVALHCAYVLSVAAMTAAGYALYGGDGRVQALAALLIGCISSLVLIGETHQLHNRIGKEAERNAELAKGLAAERSHLEQMNERLNIANAQLDNLSRHDQLTGLPNRLQFVEHIDALNGQKDRKIHLAYLDLDGFKAINDGMGHSAGDALLIRLAERLTNAVANDELVARLGGDELVVVSPTDDPAKLGERLCSVFAEPFKILQRSVAVSGSVGVAEFSENDTVDMVLRHADAALYRAKEKSGPSYTIFDASVRIEVNRVRDAEEEISSALESGRIVPYIQPVVSFATGRVVGGEALARWEHPNGLRAADSFIDIAKTMGLLDAITERTLDKVSSILAELDADGLFAPPIAVNVSPAHINGLLESRRLEFAHPSIEIEITEGEDLRDLTRLSTLLAEARALGLRVALDDFGVGYSSFAHLLRLPMDVIKVDRSFVAEMTSCETAAAVIASLTSMAHRLGMDVVAEGVETVGQMDALSKLGIDRGQGYLFSPAVPAEQFVEWIATDARFEVVDSGSRSA